jgi:hypothetical protein
MDPFIGHLNFRRSSPLAADRRKGIVEARAKGQIIRMLARASLPR